MLRDQVAWICNTMPTILFQVWGRIKVLMVSCLRQLGRQDHLAGILLPRFHAPNVGKATSMVERTILLRKGGMLA